MAEQTKKIVFEAQDNGVQSTMDRLRQGSEEWARSLIRGAREYSTSGKEVINYLEQEIKLAEKRDRLASKVRQAELTTSYREKLSSAKPWQEAKITAEYRKESASISAESRLDSLQVDLLRELIETVKQTAREEIREDRKTVESTIAQEKSINQLGLDPEADEIEALKQTLQHEAVGNVKESEQEERNRFKFGNSSGRVINAATGIATQSNEFFMLAAALSAIPIAGMALSSIASKMFSSASSYEVALGQITGITGVGIRDNIGAGVGGSQFGLTASQAIEKDIAYAQARGNLDNFGGGSGYLTSLSKGLHLSEGDILTNERQARGGRDLFNPLQIFNRLAGSGVVSEKDSTLMTEYLQLSNQLGQQQIDILGRIDQGVNVDLIAGFASVGGSLANPDVLKKILPAFQSGLSHPVNAGVRALQLSTLQGINPSMSLLELEMEQEKGLLGGQNGLYLPEFIKKLKSRSGGDNDMFVRNISGSLGIGLNLASEVAGGYNRGTLTTESLLAIKKKDTGSLTVDGLYARAEAGTSDLAKSTAKISTFFETSGAKLVTALESIAGGMSKWTDKIIDSGSSDKAETVAKENLNPTPVKSKTQEFADTPPSPLMYYGR